MRYFADSRTLRGGFDVDVNATRFSNYFHVERDLVHVLASWIARAPPWEFHYAMARQAWDEVRHALIHLKQLEAQFSNKNGWSSRRGGAR